MTHRDLMAIFAHFAPPDDGGGGGGGGPPPGGQPPGGAPPAGGVDPEQLARMVNAAVTTQLGRKLESSVTAAVTAAMGPVLERIQAAPPKDKDGKDGKDAKDPSLTAMENELAAIRNQLKEKDEAAAETVKKHREEQLTAQIREGLTQSGVRKELMDGAVATLRSKFVIDPETGVATYRKQNQGWHEDLPVEAGLKDWAASDVGKAHIAPTPGGGAGTPTPGGRRNAAPASTALNPATLPTDPKERARVVKAHKIAEAKKSLAHHAGELMAGGRVTISGGLDDAE